MCSQDLTVWTLQQVVIKDVGPNRRGLWDYNKPQEVEVMELLNKRESPGILEYRAYRRFLTQRRHRIYMEYCPYGDLYDLRKWYKRHRFVYLGYPANSPWLLICFQEETPRGFSLERFLLFGQRLRCNVRSWSSEAPKGGYTLGPENPEW